MGGGYLNPLLTKSEDQEFQKKLYISIYEIRGPPSKIK